MSSRLFLLEQDFGEKGQRSVDDRADFVNDGSCFAKGTELRQDAGEGNTGDAQSLIEVTVGTKGPESLGPLEMPEMTGAKAAMVT